MHGKHEERRQSYRGGKRLTTRKAHRLAVSLLAGAIAVLALIAVGTGAGSQDDATMHQPDPLAAAVPPQPIEAPAPEQSPDQPPALEIELEPEPIDTCRFPLTPEERDLTERVVMAEAGGESFEGQMAVAQCILNACEKTGSQPSEVILAYQYAKPAEVATQSVRDAVAAVFDDGDTVTTEPIMFFYAPRWTNSEWHETQRFVMEIGGHRFFAEKGANQ